MCRHAAVRAENPKVAAKLASSSKVGGVERLARADRRHAATTDEWDADPWLLNTLGGVVDLKTGRQRPHDRADRMTKITTATPGGIMGNFLFGCMLGSTGDIGIILGLPLDIRHIAFSSANLGYAFIAFGFALPLKAILWAALGVALIGFTNLAVSFALALRTALGARGVRFEHWGALLKAIWKRFRSAPRSFVLPPRGAANDGHG